MTASGFIDDIFLAPGWCHDVPILAGYIDECVETGQTWVMDKGYVSKLIADWAKQNLARLRLRPTRCICFDGLVCWRKAPVSPIRVGV